MKIIPTIKSKVIIIHSRISSIKNSTRTFFLMIGTLDLGIKSSFVAALVTVLSIEFVFKRFPAPFEWFYSTGNIVLNVCYSIIASAIFYFINQHIPAERKKIRTYNFQHNKINLLYREIQVILWRLNVKTDDIRKLENGVSYSIDNDIVARCQGWDATQRMSAPGESINGFPNWFAYFEWKYQRLTELFNDLMIIEESIDKTTLNKLLILQTGISFFRRDHFPPIIMHNMVVDLFPYALQIVALHRNALSALESFESLPDLYVGSNLKTRMPSFVDA